MPSEDHLAGDVAIVTGAGRNIGRTVAETFADHGAAVVVADIDEERAEQTAGALRDDGAEATAVAVDVRSKPDVEAMVEATVERYGDVDVLVNNAAVSERTPFLDLSVEEFERTLSVNLLGTFLCTQAAAEAMRQTDGGRIVNFASTSAHVARPNAAAYAASKSGVLNLTRTAANALAPHDIRVNAISPTRTGSAVGSEEERTGEPDPDILVGRWGEPRDQANAALFLASELSAFVDGAELVVDGGGQASTYE